MKITNYPRIITRTQRLLASIPFNMSLSTDRHQNVMLIITSRLTWCHGGLQQHVLRFLLSTAAGSAYSQFWDGHVGKQGIIICTYRRIHGQLLHLEQLKRCWRRAPVWKFRHPICVTTLHWQIIHRQSDSNRFVGNGKCVLVSQVDIFNFQLAKQKSIAYLQLLVIKSRYL